jgi:alginate O-acetyltransferase complex protein AlgI
MLFNSTLFVFLFLPVTLAGYFLLRRVDNHRWAIVWLVIVSSAFYSWFSLRLLALLAVLILFNYAVGMVLARGHRSGQQRPALLAFGIGSNLLILAYFKYTNFLIENSNALFGTHFVLQNILLPIGISFFTFQKIGYLVDAYRGEAEEYNLLDFSLFVMYFPQLIAGPIVHHKEIIFQFRTVANHFSGADLAGGLALFTIGLLKKTLFADTLVGWVDPVFASAQAGHVPDFYAAWTAALGFTLQIYFDFSGYTDMALGLALTIGIRLPLNFNSPYKATSIIDFWRRWHITLSRFLRDYVYIPLGGNRRGPSRRHANLLLTMLIGGLWHGAAWTFVAWGGLHGLYLVVNHAWQRVRDPLGFTSPSTGATRLAAGFLTFGAVVFAWVFFRAESFSAALNLLQGMIGRAGFGLPAAPSDVTLLIIALTKRFGLVVDPHSAILLLLIGRATALAGLLLIVFLMPNSQQLLAMTRPALERVEPQAIARWLQGAARKLGVVQTDGRIALNGATGLAFASALLLAMAYQAMRSTSLRPFIYFQF